MAITITDGFHIRTTQPLDWRAVKKTTAERDAIPASERYEGLRVYVTDEKRYYIARSQDGAWRWEVDDPAAAYLPLEAENIAAGAVTEEKLDAAAKKKLEDAHAHTTNTDNPHHVAAAQVEGLSYYCKRREQAFAARCLGYEAVDDSDAFMGAGEDLNACTEGAKLISVALETLRSNEVKLLAATLDAKEEQGELTQQIYNLTGKQLTIRYTAIDSGEGTPKPKEETIEVSPESRQEMRYVPGHVTTLQNFGYYIPGESAAYDPSTELVSKIRSL